MKKSIAATAAGVVAVFGLAGCVSVPGTIAPTQEAGTPAGVPSNDTKPASEPELKPGQGTEDIGWYSCKSLRDDLAQMSEDQRTDFDALLIAVKNWETLKDIQLDVNYPRNGWLLRCEGTAIWSGEANSRISYGIKKEAGQTFLSYEEIW